MCWFSDENAYANIYIKHEDKEDDDEERIPGNGRPFVLSGGVYRKIIDDGKNIAPHENGKQKSMWNRLVCLTKLLLDIGLALMREVKVAHCGSTNTDLATDMNDLGKPLNVLPKFLS